MSLCRSQNLSSSLNPSQARYLAVLAGVLFAGWARSSASFAATVAAETRTEDCPPASGSRAEGEADAPEIARALPSARVAMEELHYPDAIPGAARERGRSFLREFRTEAAFYDVCHYYADRLFAEQVPLMPVRSGGSSAREGWRIEPSEKDRVHRAALYRFHEDCRIGVYVTRGQHDSHTHIHLRYDVS